MSRLDYKDLPEDVRKAYTHKEIHKIVKPSQTILSIHTKSRQKDTWRKSGSTWTLMPKDSEEDVCDIQQNHTAIL